MSAENARRITNDFQDVHLASLKSWSAAAEINPRDSGGPYVVMQKGYDPADTKLVPDEFVLGRTGKWLSVALFYRLPVPERRAEFVFGTTAEVMRLLGSLPPTPSIVRPGEIGKEAAAAPENDEMAAAIKSGTPPA